MPGSDLDALSDEELAAAEGGRLPEPAVEEPVIEGVEEEVLDDGEFDVEEGGDGEDITDDELNDFMDRGSDIEESVDDGMDESLFEENFDPGSTEGAETDMEL